MIEMARENLRGRKVRLLKGQLHDLDLPDRSFDKIVCSEVLEHTVDPEQVLAEIRRLLHPDGRVVITLPNDYLIRSVKTFVRKSCLTRLPLFQRISWGGDEYHLHLWRIREMRALLDHHLSVVRYAAAPCRWLPLRCCFQCAVA
jgi:ubiquinone/menaquinone biosynthesis C-methylase UbiE